LEKSIEALMLYRGAIRAIFYKRRTRFFLGGSAPKLLLCDRTRRDGSASTMLVMREKSQRN
jgi:hypothetical protein